MSLHSSTAWRKGLLLRQFGISLSLISAAHATDIYNTGNNQLSIKSVGLADTVYTDVVVTVDSVVAIMGGAPQGSIDTYDPFLNQLTIPSVLVNGTAYTNVVISVGKVISVGGAYADGEFTAALVTATLPN